MRAIDANKLQQRIIDEKDEIITDNHHAIGMHNGLTLAQAMIINAPTIEVPRWISVTERLPTWADGNKYGGILAIRRGHELSDLYHCNDVKENPDEFTHWMPLPKLLKDGDRDER